MHLVDCDTASALAGRGKKTAWNLWRTFLKFNEAFIAVTHLNLDDYIMDMIERFTILLYDMTSSILSINDARKDIFTKASAMKSPDHIQLKQH